MSFRSSPIRFELHNEIHARPPVPISTPHRVSYVALLADASQQAAVVQHIQAVCKAQGIAPPASDARHFGAQCGLFRLNWERHAEFVSYTVFVPSVEIEAPFKTPAFSFLPAGTLDTLPGEVLVALNVVVLEGATPPSSLEHAGEILGNTDLVGSTIADDKAQVFSDFRIHEDGWSRFVLFNHALSPQHAGREVQRLIELEAYRIMAMMGLPIAQKLARELNKIEPVVDKTAASLVDAGRDKEPALLDSLTNLAATLEHLNATSAFRFAATRAYSGIVEQRLRALRELRVSGVPTMTGFLERRFTPSMETCVTVQARLRDLAERVTRASQLLRTRVDVARSAQNHELLASMDRRAKLQLRLQQTVEGLSVAAITYYGAGLIGYIAKGIKAAGVKLDPDLVVGLSIIPMALVVAWSIHHIRSAIERRVFNKDELDELP